MSNMQNSQLDLIYPPNLIPPTFYTNVVQLGMVGDEEMCFNFAVRSPEKPAVQANLQCRIIQSVANVRRMNQALSQILAQYDQQVQAAKAQAQAQTAATPARHPGM